MDGYSKPYGYMKLLDWEQFLQRAIYVGVHSVRICRCSEREIEQSHHPIVVCRLLLLPQTAVLPQETVLQRDRQPPLETARLCLLPAVWTQVLQGGVLYSALEDDTPQYKAQRDLGGISNLCCVVRHWVSASHPCKIIISLPQLCQDYGSFSLTEKASLISTRTWDSPQNSKLGWSTECSSSGQVAKQPSGSKGWRGTVFMCCECGDPKALPRDKESSWAQQHAQDASAGKWRPKACRLP